MAESEAKLETTGIASRDGEGRGNNPNPISSLFSKFPFFNFPPLKRGAAKPELVVSEQPTRTVGEFEGDETKPVVVKFPHARPEMPSLKLEAEESEQNTNPIVLWQVYAIGGFFVFRWLLARWKERTIKKRPSDEEPSPADD